MLQSIMPPERIGGPMTMPREELVRRLAPLALAALLLLPSVLAAPPLALGPGPEANVRAAGTVLCTPGTVGCGLVPGFVEETGDTMAGDIAFGLFNATFGGHRLHWRDADAAVDSHGRGGLFLDDDVVCTESSVDATCGLRVQPGNGFAIDDPHYLRFDDADCGTLDDAPVVMFRAGPSWRCGSITDAPGISIDTTGAGLHVGLREDCSSGDVLRYNLGDTGTHEWRCSESVTLRNASGLRHDAAGDLGLEECDGGEALLSTGDAWECGEALGSNGIQIDTTRGGLWNVSLTTCGDGEVLKSEGSTWNCAYDPDTIYTTAPGGGLQLTGNAFALGPCSAGQILRDDNDGWTCDAAVRTIGGVLPNENGDFAFTPGANLKVGPVPSGLQVALTDKPHFGPGTLATRFDTDESPIPVAGEVVAIDPNTPDKVRRARTGLNEKLVIGVVDGAYRMDFGEGSVPVATTGKAQVLVKALPGNPIGPGDLLVAGPEAGIANECTAPDGCPGRVIGKALQGYTSTTTASGIWAMLSLA